jgi:raffinose/stachyose/melibiose transport system substrate-binding protein
MAPPPRRSGSLKWLGIAAAAVAGLLVTVTAFVAAVTVPRWLDSADPAAPPSDSPGLAAGDDGVVEWWNTGTEGPLERVWGELSVDFEAQHEGASVSVTSTPNPDYAARIAAAIAAGGPPDLFESSGGDPLRTQVQAGQVRDLTDDLAGVIEQLSPSSLAPFTVDGRVYGIPVAVGMTGIWYNKALFVDAGMDPVNPPATWSEFLDTVDALNAAGITPIALAGAETWTGGFWYGNLAMRTAGVDALAEAAEQRSFDHPDLLRAAELLAELAAREPFQDGYESAGYAAPGGQAALVGDGEAAMELMGEWAPAVQESGSSSGGLGDELGWFPFPEVEDGNGAPGAGYGGGTGFVVSADASATTLEFLEFLLSDGSYQQVLTAQPDWVSVRAGAVTPADDPSDGRLLAAVQDAPEFQVYLDLHLPAPAGIELLDSVGQLLAGTLDPATMIAQANDALQRAPEVGG